ncbi:MAG: PqqD family protein [Candidatus Electrothrix sp. AUS4]|nr:PqqD family protein [Candidatus Electrothrix sp. AUS4]
MQNSRKFTLHPDFTTEAFDDEILLYAVSTGKGVYLNRTAGLVLELCASGHSVEEIITLLEDAFPEQKEDIRRDVETAVEALLEHGALLRADQ